MVVERSPPFSKTMSQHSEEFEDIEDLETLDRVAPRPPNQNNNNGADDDQQDDDPPSYADLLKAFNETREELKRQRLVIQNLNSSLATLERRDPGPASQQSSREPKVKMPDVFEGKVSEYNTFISQCLLIFRMYPATYGDNKHEDKILFVISYLGGTPRKWAIPILENEKHPLRLNFETFKTALDTMYADRNLKQKARDKLSLLKQTKSVASYSAEFQQIIAPLNLRDDDDSKMSMFYTNLDQNIKDQLIFFPPATTFAQLLDQCIAIDQRNYNHRKAKQSAEKSSKPQPSNPPGKPNNNNGSNNFKKSNYPNSSGKSTNFNRPSNSNSSSSSSSDLKRKYPSYHREPLSEEEKKRRRDNNLCGYCGSSEHPVEDCPRKPQTATNIHPRSPTPGPSNPTPEYSHPKFPPGKW
jgi:hypothetical protein